MKSVKSFLYTMLVAIFITAFFSSFFTCTSLVFNPTIDKDSKNEVLTIYFNSANSIPFSSAGSENLHESNFFQVSSNNLKSSFLFNILSHTQLCHNKFIVSNYFFLDIEAQRKIGGYYLLDLCKLLI